MKLFYGLVISSVLVLSSLGIAYGQIYHDFPPTDAFKTIFADSGNVTAQTYYGNVTFVGNNMIITPDYANNIITFTGVASKGNGTVNSLTCPANQFFNSYNNGTHTFTCGTPSASGSGTTLDTIENLTPAQAYIYKKNSTNTNFQFYGINGTNGITVSNGTKVLTIKGTVYQNNTGSNLGTHGSGVFDSMNGAVLQFLKILSANNLLGVSSNGTNVILTVQNVITNAFKSNSITCSAGAFFSAFSNSTGTYTCTAGNTGTITTSQNVGHAQNSKGVLATPTSSVIKGKNMSSTRTDLISFANSNSTDIIASSSFKSNTITCSSQFLSAFSNSTGSYTCSNGLITAQNVGHASGSKGTLATPTTSIVKGKNMSSTTNLISFSTSNSTDIIASSSFKSNTITCTNQFISAFSNSTGLFTCSTGFNNIQNIGKGGFGVLKQSGSIIQSKNITCGIGLSCSTNATDIRINATSSGGTITTSQNTGRIPNSIGLLNTPTSTAIRAKNLTCNLGLQCSGNATDIQINETSFEHDIFVELSNISDAKNIVEIDNNYNIVHYFSVSGVGDTGLGFNPLNGMLYAANQDPAGNNANKISVFNTTNKLSAQAPRIISTSNVFNNNDGNMWILNATGNVMILNQTNKLIKTTGVITATPLSMFFNYGNNDMYFTDCNGGIKIVNSTYNIIKTLAIAGSCAQDISYNPNTNNIYVTDGNNPSVYVINNTFSNIKTITVGTSPIGIAFNPNNGMMYVANSGSNTVSVINSTNAVIKTITVGSTPNYIKFNPNNGNMLVTNFGDGTLSVIDANYNVIKTLSFGSTSQPGQIAINMKNFLPNSVGGNIGTRGTEVYTGAHDNVFQLKKLLTTNNNIQITNNATNVLINYQASKTNATASANKTGTTGFTMLGDGVTLTPTSTTSIEILVSGYGTQNTAADGGAVQIRQVTGGCPANGAAVTGTALGSNIKMTMSATTTKVPFQIGFQTSGLSLAQKYCFELTQQAITGGTFTVNNVMWTAKELR